MDVSVIICAFTLERWDMLVRAVESVQAQARPAAEIIVVIDGNDELRARAAAELQGTIVLSNRHGPGSSGGRQTGADAARSDVLALLDDDAIAEPQWLAELIADYDDPRVLGAGGSIEPLWLGKRPDWLPPEMYWTVGCTYAGMPVKDGRIRNPISANMSIRADVLKRTGGFGPLARLNRGNEVSGTAEETEFSIRAARMNPGAYWAYRPAARVWHTVPEERTTWWYFVRRCQLEGRAKATLTGLAGSGDGLASERVYIRSVLPRAVARESAAALHGQSLGLLRAGAVLSGLSITTVAYGEQRMRLRWRSIRHARASRARRLALGRRRFDR